MLARRIVTDEDLRALAEAFVGAQHGDVAVIEAHAEIREDEETEFILVSLALRPPPAGKDTWPVDDFYLLRQEVRRRAGMYREDDVRIAYVGGGPGGSDEEALDTDKQTTRPVDNA